MSEILDLERTLPPLDEGLSMPSHRPWEQGGIIQRAPTQEELMVLSEAALAGGVEWGDVGEPDQGLNDDVGDTIPRDWVMSETTRTRPGAEFKIDNFTFGYKGRVYHDGPMVFESVDGTTGTRRSVLVYRSNSQGSRRVSQGYEQGVRGNRRIIKGGESDEGQYTQDTQMHPRFRDAIERVEENRGLRDMTCTEVPLFDEEMSELVRRDFIEQVETTPIKRGELDEQLHKLKAGALGKNNLEQITGIYPHENSEAYARASAAFMSEIEKLNGLLETSGVMPDFSGEPVAMGMDSHSELGTIVTEKFMKVVDGVAVEWEMARTYDGTKIWIERIRKADVDVSAYGTDKEVVYSGVLTSKPLEYNFQCDGIPQNLRRSMGRGSNYSDITPFLATFAPIKMYAQSFGRRQHLYHAP